MGLWNLNPAAAYSEPFGISDGKFQTSNLESEICHLRLRRELPSVRALRVEDSLTIPSLARMKATA